MSEYQFIQVGIEKDRAHRNAEMQAALAAQMQGDNSLYREIMRRPLPRRSVNELRDHYRALALTD